MGRAQELLRCSDTVGEGRKETAVNPKPAVNPTTNPLSSGRGELPHPELWFPTCSISTLCGKAPRKVTEEHGEVNSLNHHPRAMKGWQPSVGKLQHGEDQREESIPIRTLQIPHPWPCPCPVSFLFPHEDPAFPSPPPSAFQLFPTALQGQWMGRRERAASAFGAAQQPGTDLLLHPYHQPLQVPKSPVLDPALNECIPEQLRK